jgi:hypothetical protein
MTLDYQRIALRHLALEVDLRPDHKLSVFRVCGRFLFTLARG